MVKTKKGYKKPSIKSSKLKTIFYYSRGAIVSADEAEFLLAGVIS